MCWAQVFRKQGVILLTAVLTPCWHIPRVLALVLPRAWASSSPVPALSGGDGIMRPNPPLYRTCLAQGVATRREAANLTQDELAKAIQSTQHTISQLENPYAPTPRLGTLLRLADFFRTSLDALCGRAGGAVAHDADWCALGGKLGTEDKAYLMLRGELFLRTTPVDLQAWAAQRRAHA